MTGELTAKLPQTSRPRPFGMQAELANRTGGGGKVL